MIKPGQKLTLTKSGLSKYPEYKGAELRLVKLVAMKGSKGYLGYKVKVIHKKPYTEVWDKSWFEQE